jgi:D-xylose transport system ATP-binding protein
MSAPWLALKEITKIFPGTKALDRVNLAVRPGEVVALLGENGAGKSTLMKILSGVWPEGSFEGEILIEGKPARFRDTRDAHAAGIAMIHQELSVFPELTIAEHLELDRLPAWITWEQVHARTQKFLDPLDFGLRSDMRVGDLSIGGRQLVEIARALYRDARLLVFDEPTSALTDQEVQRLYRIVDRLRAEGRAIIYITHRMDEVFRLADRMVVLRDGKDAGELSALREGRRLTRQELEPQIIQWMVGRKIEDIYPPLNSVFGEELLRVEGLSLRTPKGKFAVRDLSFSIRRGEILGLAGLLGAGRSETFEALFGVLHPSGPKGEGYTPSGRAWIQGKPVELATPRDAIGARMAFVSEDRKGSGLVLKQSIRSNMSLPALSSGRLTLEREADETSRWSGELRVKCARLDQTVGELSGGNQQKVVLAKWLLTEPEILFLDEPTRGIDVGAKMEIYQWIQKLASQGMAIVMASSEMPELLGLCHRTLVLREGHRSAEFMAGQASQEDIMKAASL